MIAHYMSVTENGETLRDEEIVVSNFYQDIAKLLNKETVTELVNTYVTVSTEDGYADYEIRKRSGTICVFEQENTFPDSYVDRNITERFLTCINPETNAYKFYKLEITGDEVRASYGRMGVKKGDLFGERSCMYSLSMFWIKYYEQICKGYIDQTEYYMVSEENAKVEPAVEPKTPSEKLYKMLADYARNAVKSANINVPITQKIIAGGKEILEKLRNATSVTGFNQDLLQLMAILQRPVRTYDGTGVRDALAHSTEDFGRIIQRESDLMDALSGVEIAENAQIQDFEGVEVYEATEEQRKMVLKHLTTSLKKQVKEVYRVIPHGQRERFDDYVKKHDIKQIKMFWHGSRSENWLSIIINGLQLNPNAKITGKMFGYGIYFAPSSRKSWHYTSHQGAKWTYGKDEVGIMGLYATAYGNPYNTSSWSREMHYGRSLIEKHDNNCLHAHKGSALRNDEVVFYHEEAVLLQYIVTFE